MKKLIKISFKKFFFTALKYFVIKFYNLRIIRSFSQEGEDIILNRIIDKKKKDELYLDLGSGHPIKYSNTYMLYLKGFKGIVVDANKENIELHKIIRPKDITFNEILSESKSDINFYIYKQSELNTINAERVNFLKKKKINYIKKKKIKSKNSKIFFNKDIKHLSKKIFYLNIDIEGSELEIIRSINWKIFKPSLITIEILNTELKFLNKNKIYKILNNNGYKVFSKLYNTFIFVKK